MGDAIAGRQDSIMLGVGTDQRIISESIVTSRLYGHPVGLLATPGGRSPPGRRQ